MTYAEFVGVIYEGFAKKANTRVTFDHVDGRHIAKCQGGMTLTANNITTTITCRWGSGHQATFDAKPYLDRDADKRS